MRFNRQNPDPSKLFWRCSLFTFLTFLFFGENFQVLAHDYTFCAKNVQYTFSSDACPGGILLKSPLQIDEPCHCFEGDLKIYSSCSNNSVQEQPSTPSGCSLPLFQPGGTTWNGQAMMIIPGDFGNINRTGRGSCFGMPKSCNATPETIVTKKPGKIVQFMKTISAAPKQKESSGNKTSQVVSDNSAETDSAESDEQGEDAESGSQENTNKNPAKNGTKKPKSAQPSKITETSTTTTAAKPSNSPALAQSLSSGKGNGVVKGGLEIGPVINIAGSDDLNHPLDNKIDAVQKLGAEIADVNKTNIDPIQENLRKNAFNQVLDENDNVLRLARDGASNNTEGGGADGEEEEDDSGADSEEGEDEELQTATGDGFDLTPEPADPTDVVALLRHIQGVKEGQIRDPEPNTKTFQLIKQSLRIVQRLTPNDVIKDEHLYEAYLAFNYIFRHLDETEHTDRHFTTNAEDFSAILLALEDCESSVPTFMFKTSGPLNKIEALRIPQQIGVTEQVLEIPADRAHKPDNEDYVIGVMWKIIDITHSTCYSEFKWNSPSTQFDYFVAIEDLFMQPDIQKRWNEPQILSKESEGKLDLISHPDIKLLMENLDAVDAAAHSTFGFEYFLKKPKSSGSVAKSSSAKGQRRKRKSRKIHKEHLSRKRREEPLSKTAVAAPKPEPESDWSAFEIWGGRAYCLQKQNEALPSNIQNSFPNPQTLCKN